MPHGTLNLASSFAFQAATERSRAAWSAKPPAASAGTAISALAPSIVTR